MKRLSILLAAILLFCAVAALAQRPDGPGMSGPFGQFREQHKYTFQLMGMVRGLGELEKGTKAPLTPAQAKAILAVLTPLRKQDKLTQDQAKSAMKAIKKQLTAKQLTELGKVQADRQRFRRADSGNNQGRRPQGPPPGQRPRFDLSKMKDFNPFNAKVSKDNPRMGRSAERMNAFFDDLAKKAEAKK